MTGRPAARPDYWVVCPDWASGPYTADGAEARRAKFARDGLCSLPHTIVRQATRPAAGWRDAKER